MSDNYKVSIITACYNSEKTIERTLKVFLLRHIVIMNIL